MEEVCKGYRCQGVPVIKGFCERHRKFGEGRGLGEQKSHVTKASVCPTMRDLSWAAGFLDGEGYFGKPRGKRRTERIAAGQKDDWLLKRLQRILGGSIYPMKQRTGSYTSYQLPLWVVTGPRARGIMMTLYTLMSPRRQTAIRKALI